MLTHLKMCTFKMRYMHSRLLCLNKLTSNQREYKTHLNNYKPLHVVQGVAGTGKTMIACETAESLILSDDNKYERLILTQPLTTVSNEQIGFLPGEMDHKVSPWSSTMQEYINRVHVEFVPLGHMRGKTWNNSIIIADEMQNSSVNQMKTLLTRVGENSMLVLIGDNAQKDTTIEEDGFSDLLNRITSLSSGYYDISTLDVNDIKRSGFVKQILSIY